MNFIISNSYKMFVFVECNIVYNIFQHIMDTEDCVTVSGLNMSAFVVQTMFFEKKLVLKTFLRKRKRQQSFFSLEETVSHSNESITNEVGRKKKLFVCHLDWCRNLQSQFNTFNFFLLR